MSPPAWRRALLAGVAALGIGAAQAQPFTANPTATLIYFDPAGNETLDPRTPQNGSSFAQGLLMAVYDALVFLDHKGDPRPGLADSWSYNADLTEFTLKLRPDVTFHDGAKLNAAAVQLNLERQAALGTRAGSNIVETANAIAGIEVLDELTVRLKLKAPNGQVPFLLGMQAGMMLSPAALAEAPFGAALRPIGAGPYQIRSAEANVRTFTTRYDGYWDGIAGRPAAFEHHYVPDGRARLNALRSGQANLALIEGRQIAEAKAAGLQVQVDEKNSTWDIYLNVKRDNIGRLNLRQAMMHAIEPRSTLDRGDMQIMSAP